MTALLARRQSLLLVTGLTAAVATRVGVGTPSPSSSIPGGLVFAVLLGALAVLAGERLPRLDRRTAGWALLGALALCVPAAGQLHLSASPDGFLPWAAAVSVVVVAEEAFLRGALFRAVQSSVAGAAGPHAAVLVTAVAFALLHVPLYGWRVLPLDLAVGVLLGALRLGSGSWAAPAGAHAIADYVGWFCR